MPEPTMTITIARGPDGEAAMWVSWAGADGAPTGPPRQVVLNNRLAGFVRGMEAFARRELAAHEPLAERCPPDDDPALVVESVDGEQAW